MTGTLDRIRASLVGLRMPRAPEAPEDAIRRLERGEICALEATDGLLAEDHATREGRRVGAALKTARLRPPSPRSTPTDAGPATPPPIPTSSRASCGSTATPPVAA